MLGHILAIAFIGFSATAVICMDAGQKELLKRANLVDAVQYIQSQAKYLEWIKSEEREYWSSYYYCVFALNRDFFLEHFDKNDKGCLSVVKVNKEDRGFPVLTCCGRPKTQKDTYYYFYIKPAELRYEEVGTSSSKSTQKAVTYHDRYSYFIFKRTFGGTNCFFKTKENPLLFDTLEYKQNRIQPPFDEKDNVFKAPNKIRFDELQQQNQQLNDDKAAMIWFANVVVSEKLPCPVVLRENDVNAAISLLKTVLTSGFSEKSIPVIQCKGKVKADERRKQCVHGATVYFYWSFSKTPKIFFIFKRGGIPLFSSKPDSFFDGADEYSY